MPSTTSSSTKSERLVLAMAIKNITMKQDGFIIAVEKMEKYQTDILANLDLEIETKKIELNDLEESYKHREKTGKIETMQRLNEFGYQASVQIIKERNETVINEDKLGEMIQNLTTMKSEYSVELDSIKSKAKESSAKELNAALTTSELKHQAEIAQISAQLGQQNKEISNLEKTIDNLRNELAEQRKLTKDVAQAGRAAPINLSTGK